MPPAPPSKKGGGDDPAFPNKTTRGKWLATIGLPACLVGLVVGAFAIMVLSEPDSALARTSFGVIVQRITGWNKLVLALVFNGSLIGAAGGACMQTVNRMHGGSGTRPYFQACTS
jgi:hypothetical protein